MPPEDSICELTRRPVTEEGIDNLAQGCSWRGVHHQDARVRRQGHAERRRPRRPRIVEEPKVTSIVRDEYPTCTPGEQKQRVVRPPCCSDLARDHGVVPRPFQQGSEANR